MNPAPPCLFHGDSIVETVRQPLLLLNEHLRIVLANSAFTALFPPAPQDAPGASLMDVRDGDWNLPTLRSRLQDVVERGTELTDLEIDHHFHGLGRRVLLVSSRPLRQNHSGGRLILVEFVDVTAQRHLERALQVTLAELQRSNRELQEFASIASHDLQEPLRKIRSFGERLEHRCEGMLPPEAHDYLTRMTGAAARMQTLIVDLLALARVSTGEHEMQRVDLERVANEVLADLETAVTAAGARVVVDSLPAIEGDAAQMRQLFQNLIANALKFGGAETPAIRISASSAGMLPLTRGGHTTLRPFCSLVIEDNGIGFDQKHAERIFTPFERLHARGVYAGTGIGLAICRRIAERHGGTIHAESVPGRGSRFVVHLPAAIESTT